VGALGQWGHALVVDSKNLPLALPLLFVCFVSFHDGAGI
jgi:hypothetical protein